MTTAIKFPYTVKAALVQASEEWRKDADKLRHSGVHPQLVAQIDQQVSEAEAMVDAINLALLSNTTSRH